MITKHTKKYHVGLWEQLLILKATKIDCWLVFANHAFPLSESSGEDRRALEKIGREIVNKCNGLPLSSTVTRRYVEERACY